MRRLPGIVVLLAGALLLRVAAAGVVHLWLSQQGRDFVIAGDAQGYWELGRRLAAGEPYAVHDPPRRVLRMPGYPGFLAFVQTIFGECHLAARLMQAVVGAVACGLVYTLGRRLFDGTTGLVAAALAAVSPLFGGFSVVLLSETLFAAAMLAGLLALERLGRSETATTRSRGLLAFGAGLLIAAACYVRPSWLLAAPLFALLHVLLASNHRRALGEALLLLAGLGVSLAPWAWRNHRVTGHVVLTTTWLGPSLYDGLNPKADGSSDMRFYEADRAAGVTRGMSEVEIDRYYRRRAWQFVRENPGRTLVLAGRKLIRFWKPWPSAAEFRSPWLLALSAAFEIPLFVLAARGLWVARRRVWVWLLTFGPVLYFTLLHVVFVGSIRYRLPAEYALCVPAAAGLRSWWPKRSAAGPHEETTQTV